MDYHLDQFLIFHENENVIDIYYNKGRLGRKLSPITIQYILSYINDLKIKENDYLIFNEYKNNNSFPREKYVTLTIIKALSKNKI